jgi:hypothetical protein
MFVFLRNGERVEIPDATKTLLEGHQFYCLDSAGNVLREFPAAAVVIFSMDPWDFLWDAIRKWTSDQ